MGLNIRDSVFIQSYKHNGQLHRTWSKAMIIDETDDFYVAVTDRSWVVESDGRRWLTKEPAICFFYKKRWFNVMSMVRKTGIYYYCNIATPSLYDGEAIKNIDYDLDVKVFPDGTYNILDENEYQYHSQLMNYPKDIKDIVEDELKNLVQMIEEKKEPFKKEYIDDYLLRYFQMTMIEE